VSNFKIGHGYDVHRLVSGRPLVLGGVNIPYELGLLGHSDADVLLHAVMDAILGALGLSDIGKHFPDTDPKYKGISSLKLLSHVKCLLDENGAEVGNIDATVVAEKPKLISYIPAMRENIANILCIDASSVNIKATTEEGLGFTGSIEGISAHAVTLIKIK
jgi:2-C-methyl-D-erythritol 2,4-cyclodiphosphate synthase